MASLSCLQVNRSSIWTSSRVLLAAENKSGGQLSDELKNIMSKKFGEEEQKSAAAADLKEAKEKADEKAKLEEEKKTATGWGKYFTREHGWKISFLFFTGMFGGLGIYILIDWGAPRRDDNNNIIKDEFSDLPVIIQYPKRAINSVLSFYQMVKDPSTDKLLPDPIQPPYYQPPYTLVIELSGILLHPEWTFNTGWRYKKRPGLDYFLEQVKYPTFEVVFFTREPYLSGAPIVASLDPQGHIQFKLFRESTKFINNNYVKDLSYMNRDPSKIIVIDWDENAYQLQPRNALHRLRKWDGNENDADLVYLASFLKMIATSGVSDVREVLDFYNKEIDPLDSFKLKQAKLVESENERKKQLEEIKEKQKKSFSFFRR